MNAEADLIATGTLVESIKTGLGGKRKDGQGVRGFAGRSCLQDFTELGGELALPFDVRI